MKRGLFEGIIPEELIKATGRNWNVLLLKSLDIWGELAFSESLLSGNKSSIKKQIIEYIYPNDDFDRFPIYYISIRPKTRFIKHFKFRSSDKKKITLTFLEGIIPRFIKFNVEEISKFLGIDYTHGVTICVESKYIICTNGSKTQTVSIYDLLFKFGYKYKYKNKIMYVGYSENPEDRPFKGAHEGLTQMLYQTYNRKIHDIFINYQQFHVNSLLSSESGISIQGSNTMLNEVDIKTEAKIIESILIKYYLEEKRKNYKKEIGYLKNRIDIELAELNIQEIDTILNYYQSNSMFLYQDPQSKKIKIPKFNIKNEQGKILLTTAST